MKAITRFRGKYFFLSNFFQCKVPYKKHVYDSAEHAYQASKVMFKIPEAYSSDEKFQAILNSKTAAIAKRIGRSVELPTGWNEIKIPIMFQIVKNKFYFNRILRNALLETKDRMIYEGNDHKDRFWGVHPTRLTGYNILGIILMTVRESLKNQ